MSDSGESRSRSSRERRSSRSSHHRSGSPANSVASHASSRSTSRSSVKRTVTSETVSVSSGVHQDSLVCNQAGSLGSMASPGESSGKNDSSAVLNGDGNLAVPKKKSSHKSKSGDSSEPPSWFQNFMSLQQKQNDSLLARISQLENKASFHSPS